jgi:hypothetical protein
MAKFENPIADWPKARVIKKEGGGVHITGRYLHPSLAHNMPQVYGLIGFVLCLLVFVASANPFPPLLLAGLLWAFYSLWKSTMTNMFGKKVDVRMFPDKIEVRNGFFYKKYSRAVPMELRIEQHHKGLLETAKEIKTGRRQKVLYRNAIEVVMQYGEVRVSMAEFEAKDIERAKALLFRMQTAMQRIDFALQEAEKMAKQENEFGPGPSLP